MRIGVKAFALGIIAIIGFCCFFYTCHLVSKAAQHLSQTAYNHSK